MNVVNEGLCIVPNPLNIKFIDESDKKFYEVAKFINCPLITGNKKHFPEETIVLSPKEFMNSF